MYVCIHIQHLGITGREKIYWNDLIALTTLTLTADTASTSSGFSKEHYYEILRRKKTTETELIRMAEQWENVWGDSPSPGSNT